MEQECLPKLIKGITAKCNFIVSPKNFEVLRVNNNTLLINSNEKFTVNSDCGMSNRTLLASYLIEFEACQVSINDTTTYTTKATQLHGADLFYPLDGITINSHYDVLNLTIDHLYDLYQQMRRELDHVLLENNSFHFIWPSISIFGGVIMPITMTTVFFILYYKCRTRRSSPLLSCCNSTSQQQPDDSYAKFPKASPQQETEM